MFLDQDRPLYRAGGHYPLGPIELKAWLPFVRARFRKTGKTIPAGIVRDLFDITGGHPFYTQHLCHAVWELCEPNSEVSGDTLENAIRLLLERESHAYTALWETLAVNQRRFLVGLASVEEGVGVFAAEFLRRSNLQTPSSVQRVVENLIERDIIDREDGTYFISDRFFRLWIRKTSGI
jgi:hypothetical protein